MKQRAGAHYMPEDFVLGIDIGGTEIKAGLVDSRGKIHARKTLSSKSDSPEAFRRTLNVIVAELHKKLSRSKRLRAAGIGCKGIIDPDICRVRILPGPLRFLEGQPLDQWIQQALGSRLKVSLDNDAKVALIGERRWGAAHGKSHVVLLTLGTGVGGAILSDGKMVRGTADIAGHLGHVTIDVDGPRCSCGNRGCLEAFFSARAIEGEALAAIRRGCESQLRAAFAAKPEALSCHDVFLAASAGDALAKAIIRRAVSSLAAAMAGLAHALDPELFIVGGQIAEAGRSLFTPLRKEFFERTTRLVGRRIPIRKAALGEAAGFVGAAALAWNAIEGG